MEKLVVGENQPFKISLKGYAHGGYLWEHEPEHERFLVKTTEPIGTDNIVGNSPNEVFLFLPLPIGVHELKFVCKRPWEEGSLQEETVEVEVVEDRNRAIIDTQ